MRALISLYNFIVVLTSILIWFILSPLTWFEIIIIAPIYFIIKKEIYFFNYSPICLICAAWFYYKFINNKYNDEKNAD